ASDVPSAASIKVARKVGGLLKPGPSEMRAVGPHFDHTLSEVHRRRPSNLQGSALPDGYRFQAECRAARPCLAHDHDATAIVIASVAFSRSWRRLSSLGMPTLPSCRPS